MATELESIEVNKLFGYLSYDLKDLNEDVLTFIIGKNGMGKTTLLHFLFELGHQQFNIFRKTQFESIKFLFKTGRKSKTIHFKKDKKGICKWKVEYPNKKSKFQELPFGYSDLMSDKEKVAFLEKNTDEVEIES